MKITVGENAKNGLCCSCGICSALCAVDAISYEEMRGMYVPSIDATKCTKCGICASICPGFQQNYESEDGNVLPIIAARGEIHSCFNAWSKDPEIRHVSASGGVVTTLLENLLEKKEYDCAFCVDSYSYETQLQAKLYTYDAFRNQRNDMWRTPKSRYLPVSHEMTIKYMLSNRESKIIIVAVPCALKAIESIIKKYRLNRANYLLIGLFCERNFQYNIFKYFSTLENEKQLVAMHFKNKESGGWPGNVKLIYSDGSEIFKDKSYRTNAKSYFQPERCLYCIDKLAVSADIALGDNYTGIDESELGSNSVIIRTNRGQAAWMCCTEKIESRSISYEAIEQAEVMEERVKNVYFAELKKKELEKKNEYVPSINTGVCVGDIPSDYEIKYREALERLHVGCDEMGGYLEYRKHLQRDKQRKKRSEKIYIWRYRVTRILQLLRKVIKTN